MSDPTNRRTAREELERAVGEAIFAEVKKFPTPPPWSGVVAPLGASVEDVGRAAMAVIDAAGWPDSETERPRRCPALVPEGNVVTEGRQCQQYEGHPHDHTWYGDNGAAYSAWSVNR